MVVTAPSVVHKYNDTMGGVDLGDQLLLKFEPQFKGVKLWRKILFNLLTTATGICISIPETTKGSPTPQKAPMKPALTPSQQM